MKHSVLVEKENIADSIEGREITKMVKIRKRSTRKCPDV